MGDDPRITPMFTALDRAYGRGARHQIGITFQETREALAEIDARCAVPAEVESAAALASRVQAVIEECGHQVVTSDDLGAPQSVDDMLAPVLAALRAGRVGGEDGPESAPPGRAPEGQWDALVRAFTSRDVVTRNLWQGGGYHPAKRPEAERLADVALEALAAMGESSVAATDREDGPEELAEDDGPPRDARGNLTWWQHEDGTSCPVFLAPRPYPSPTSRWWCTEHQQHLVPGNLDMTPVDVWVARVEEMIPRVRAALADLPRASAPPLTRGATLTSPAHAQTVPPGSLVEADGGSVAQRDEDIDGDGWSTFSGRSYERLPEAWFPATLLRVGWKNDPSGDLARRIEPGDGAVCS